MVTRTSISSLLWRFLVAEASAASSAWKMISFSTPFSLETTSTISRMFLFMLFPFSILEMRDEMRALDLVQPEIHLAFVGLHRHGPVRVTHRTPGVPAAAAGARRG